MGESSLRKRIKNYEFKGKIDQNVLNIVLQELKESNYTLPDDIKEVGIDEYKIIPASVTGYKDRVILERRASDLTQAEKDIINRDLYTQSAYNTGYPHSAS